MIGSHGPVVKGVDAIADILESYHDAIKYVHDQTIRSTELLYELDDVIGFGFDTSNIPLFLLSKIDYLETVIQHLLNYQQNWPIIHG